MARFPLIGRSFARASEGQNSEGKRRSTNELTQHVQLIILALGWIGVGLTLIEARVGASVQVSDLQRPVIVSDQSVPNNEPIILNDGLAFICLVIREFGSVFGGAKKRR